MKKYYAVISKESFIKLRKFGRVRGFEADMLDTAEDNIEIKLKKILYKIDFLSGEEEEIIILKINNKHTENNIDRWYEIKIENVENYYLLSNKAQQFYLSKISSKLNFELFPNKNILNDLEQQKEIEDMERGSEILLKQFGFEKRNILNKNILDKEFNVNLRLFLKSDNYLEVKYENYYFDLLSYRRKNKFKKEDVSYIHDLMILLHLKDRKIEKVSRFNSGEIQLESSSTHKLLENNKKENLLEYINFIESSEDEKIKIFIEKIEMKNLIIGALFLKFKENKENNNMDEIKKYIKLFSTTYKEELIIALYFIGLVFGYEKLRDEYYDYIGYSSVIDEDTIVKKLFKNEEITKEKNKGFQKSLLKIGDNHNDIIDIIFEIMKIKNNNLKKVKNSKSVSIKNKNKTIINISLKNSNIEINLKNMKEIEKNKKIIEESLKQVNKRELKLKYDEKTKKYILTFNKSLRTSKDDITNIFKELIL